MAYEAELDAALGAALLAGEAIMRFRDTLTPDPMAPPSISTPADRSAQDMLIELIQESFPDDAFVAEEDTEAYRDVPHLGPRQWVIDPIDGTGGFARGSDDFCVMVGLAVEGHVVMGVVLEPARNRVAWATEGGGCFEHEGRGLGPGREVFASGVAELEQARLGTSRYREAPHKVIAQRLGVLGTTPIHSAGVKLAMVARGEIDLYVEPLVALSDWDICAGHILVTEAGGRVTDCAGGELVYGRVPHKHPRGLAASNGCVHAAALERLARAGGLATD
jgi:3'(2'), 5'-bisphosphate nucleotidase